MSDGDRLGSRQSMNRNLRDQLLNSSQASAAPPSSELPQPTPEGRVKWLDRGTENRGLGTPSTPPPAPRSSPSTSRRRQVPDSRPTPSPSDEDFPRLANGRVIQVPTQEIVGQVPQTEVVTERSTDGQGHMDAAPNLQPAPAPQSSEISASRPPNTDLNIYRQRLSDIEEEIRQMRETIVPRPSQRNLFVREAEITRRLPTAQPTSRDIFRQNWSRVRRDRLRLRDGPIRDFQPTESERTELTRLATVRRLGQELGELFAHLDWLIRTLRDEPRYATPVMIDGFYDLREVVLNDGRWIVRSSNLELPENAEIVESNLQTMIATGFILETNNDLRINIPGIVSSSSRFVDDLGREIHPDLYAIFRHSYVTQTRNLSRADFLEKVGNAISFIGQLLPVLRPAASSILRVAQQFFLKGRNALRNMPVPVPLLSVEGGSGIYWLRRARQPSRRSRTTASHATRERVANTASGARIRNFKVKKSQRRTRQQIFNSRNSQGTFRGTLEEFITSPGSQHIIGRHGQPDPAVIQATFREWVVDQISLDPEDILYFLLDESIGGLHPVPRRAEEMTVLPTVDAGHINDLSTGRMQELALQDSYTNRFVEGRSQIRGDDPRRRVVLIPGRNRHPIPLFYDSVKVFESRGLLAPGTADRYLSGSRRGWNISDWRVTGDGNGNLTWEHAPRRRRRQRRRRR
jgi:hypothetical protein